MTSSRYHFTDTKAPHFITTTVNQWLPLFTRPETVKILYDSWQFLQTDSNFEIFGYVILENHLHMVACSDDLERDIQRFKSYTARSILDHLQEKRAQRMLELLALFKRPYKVDSNYQVWEEGVHPQLVESDEVMRQKLEYIHMNPVKRGYVEQPEHWRYSSARNYAGMEGLIEVNQSW